MNKVLEEIGKTGIVPVVVLEEAEAAGFLAEALCKGGLACAEVTFRTKAAGEAIKRMSDAFPEMLVGAGTVLSIEQAQQAMEAGAKFIVSPGLNPRVVTYCLEKEIPIIPGCMTPSEIEQALELGLDTVKFFPAEQAGGLAMIKALAAPYGGIKFMPTGGIDAKKAGEYLSYSRVLACGGSWMVKNDLIQNGEFERITELVREAADLVRECRQK
ncbi:MAG: bifunctional 4-hydroxy-2-oxoglutarate aldolase/2-dehydro-3-deoxy-phosphogluconate aldolase [Lachnospiraceae bacterium]